MSNSHDTDSNIENADRREAMSAILKYSAVVGGSATTVLSASQAVARSAASGAGAQGPERWKLGREESKNWNDREWEKWREWERWRERRIDHWEKYGDR